MSLYVPLSKGTHHPTDLRLVPLPHGRAKFITFLVPPRDGDGFNRPGFVVALQLQFDAHIRNSAHLKHGGINDEAREVRPASELARRNPHQIAEPSKWERLNAAVHVGPELHQPGTACARRRCGHLEQTTAPLRRRAIRQSAGRFRKKSTIWRARWF
jgi:hypothetical protein